MWLNFFLVMLCSFLISLISVIFLKNFSKSRKVLLDKQIPLVGGLGIGIAFFLFALKLQCPLDLLISSGIILIFGVVDDIYGMSVFLKFLVQIMATAMLILSGIVTHIMCIGLIGNIFVTFFWVIGITNAFNHLDVMDGLAASTALIVGMALCTASFLVGNMFTAFLSLIIIGSVAGFIFFNFPPAKAYLGNAGSHFLGFMLSAVAIMISYADADRKIALLAPLFILGFPIFDTMFLIFIRAMKERSVFKKSDDHLALRFLKIGYSKRRTLLVMSFSALFFALSGLSLIRIPGLAAYALVGIVVVGSFIFAKKFSRVQI